jgi:hypothetical protein
MLTAVRLLEFLRTTNTVGTAELPAYIHCTPAGKIYDIINAAKLKVFACNVFRGENLCYLFLGRPAFKWSSDGEASYWQCPLAFLFRDIPLAVVKRIFPFDSAAFAKDLFPNYITMFGLDRYDLGTDISISGKLITAFFGSVDRYLAAKNTGLDDFKTQFPLTSRFQEIEALVRLYGDLSGKHDDRRSAIEVQLQKDIPLQEKNLIGIILPENYKTDEGLVARLASLKCIVKYYKLYPVKVENYYSQIYEMAKTIQETAFEK